MTGMRTLIHNEDLKRVYTGAALADLEREIQVYIGTSQLEADKLPDHRDLASK